MNNQLFTETKGYATQENAMKAFNKATGHIDTDFRIMMTVTPEGRFAVVALLTNEQSHLMHYLISKNICVVM